MATNNYYISNGFDKIKYHGTHVYTDLDIVLGHIYTNRPDQFIPARHVPAG